MECRGLDIEYSDGSLRSRNGLDSEYIDRVLRCPMYRVEQFDRSLDTGFTLLYIQNKNLS